MESKMNVMLMFAKPYEIQDDETKEKKSGVSVEYYFFGNNGEAIAPKMRADNGEAGIRRSKCSLDYSVSEKIAMVPGIYEGSFEMSVGADGKPVLKMVDIEFKGAAAISMTADVEDPGKKK